MGADIVFPDYGNSILGIPNSILAHYGLPARHRTLPVLDARLRDNPKNVVLLIFDGLGSAMLENGAPGGFLLRNRAADLSSVYPCTTTAATVALSTGLSPIEHGWLGWSCYFKEIGKRVDLFSGKESGTERLAANGGFVWERLGYGSVSDRIADRSPDVETPLVAAFSPDHKAETCEEVCAHIRELCGRPGRRYIYAYLSQPDHDAHEFGCRDGRVVEMIAGFDRQTGALCADLKDALMIVTADHGHTNMKMFGVEDFPEINECLAVPPSMEPRCVSLFVKEEMKDVFPGRWEKRFSGEFLLMTKQEALGRGIFGSGEPHPRALDFLGDYLALAVGKTGLCARDENGKFKDFAASHAGLKREEMTVPLVLARTSN